MFLVSLIAGIGFSLINIDTNKTEYSGIVIQSRENYYIFSTGLERFYIKNVDNNYEVGDVLSLKGEKYEYTFETLESAFDFNQYLKDKGINYGFNVKSSRTYFKNPIRFSKYKKDFLNKFKDESRDFIGSLYFGSGYNNDFSKTLQSLHLYRLSTLSGLSIYAILSLLTYLFSLRFDERKSRLFAFLFLSPYLLFSIGKFAIFKIVFLYILKVINHHLLKDHIDHISLLSILGILCLIFDRHLARQNGFNLSFMMSLFFYYYNNSFRHIKARKRKLISILLITLFFLPFETRFYHEISLVGPIVQMVFTPFIILISIVVTLCFYHIPLYGVATLLINTLSTIIDFIKPIFITIYCRPMDLNISLLYEIVLFSGLYYWSIRFKPLYNLNMVFYACFSVILVPFKSFNSTYISFINIGQGDSTHIHINDLDILIDTGGSLYKDIGNDVLIPYFKKQQVYAIDYLITTHDDFDHIGAKDTLMKNFRVKNYLNEPYQFPLKVGNFVMNNLNVYSTNSKDENENSLVLQFSLKSTRILVMGDAPKNIENSIIKDHPDLRCDILKVGHHGSNTSSGYNFVKTVDPDIAIISCGLNNKYGHPHDDVLAVLNSFMIDIRRTDKESTIIYTF